MIMQDIGKTTQINVEIKIRGVEETAHKKLIIQKVYLLWDVVAATKRWQDREGIKKWRKFRAFSTIFHF